MPNITKLIKGAKVSGNVADIKPSAVSDFAAAKENKALQEYYTVFKDGLKELGRKKVEATESARELGVFADFDIGNKFHTPHSHRNNLPPLEVGIQSVDRQGRPILYVTQGDDKFTIDLERLGTNYSLLKGPKGVPAAAAVGGLSVEVPETMHPEADQIRSDEGENKVDDKHVSYLDTKDKLTGGVGHLMTDEEAALYPVGTEIPDEVVDNWFAKDMETAQEDVKALVGDQEIPEEVDKILTNMALNLGRPKLKKFKKMWNAIRAKEWGIAADEMVDSDWYDDVGDRSKRLVSRMRSIVSD